jgi:hypothetical protein
MTEEAITVTTRFDAALMGAAQSELGSHNATRLLSWLPALVPAVVLGIGASLGWWGVIAGFAAATAFFAGVWVLSLRGGRRRLFEGHALNYPADAVLSAEAIQWNGPLAETRIPWGSVDRIRGIGGGTVVVLKNTSVLLIPDADLANTLTGTALRERLRTWKDR